uniref:Uncharacterized protein n=1 Tax=Picea sitchensis TaxID=3332 RepID=B8LN15_PICSI|nr:unknown [Picea sitchensis]
MDVGLKSLPDHSATSPNLPRCCWRDWNTISKALYLASRHGERFTAEANLLHRREEGI